MFLLRHPTIYVVKLKGSLRPYATSSKKSSVAQSLDGSRLTGSLRFPPAKYLVKPDQCASQSDRYINPTI